ncbi:MAG: hypothetical protein LUD14_00365 [Clostridiales bacterium]|nr:hypothetical protein [Clostridiales bacterium]
MEQIQNKDIIHKYDKNGCVCADLSFGTSIEVRLSRVGEDIHLLLSGGASPHIGCAVMSVPRPSLTGDGSVSATSSVLNVTGHKDEVICRMLSEAVCRKYNRLTVCVGGFHADHLSAEQIAEVRQAVEKELIPQLCGNLPE